MTMVTEVPELVPARMLNEYAYCPRLFFLEWVDRLWAPSSDTAEGDRQHRRVDAGGGAARAGRHGLGGRRGAGLRAGPAATGARLHCRSRRDLLRRDPAAGAGRD